MRRYLFPLLLILLFTSCRREPTYPTLLTEADSAYVRGDYDLADSLLVEFDSRGSLQRDDDHQGAQWCNQGDEGIMAYRQYLGLTQKFVRDELTDQDFSLADSLCRVYDRKGTREIHARTLLFLGDVYKLSDYPSALNCYLQAESLAKQTGNTLLQAWACQQIGDIYFDQRMLDDSKVYYRRFYLIAETRRDTLRMAHASQRMGRVYTIESNIDSTIWSYNSAASLGDSIGQEDFASYSHARLADVYIQIKEFDKAKKLMSRDTLNMFNWACYYYEQHDADSAIYYLSKLLPLYDVRVKAECLSMLADIYSTEGDFRRANEYFMLLREAEDSVKTLSQENETRRIFAQYNYDTIKQERDRMAERQKRSTFIIVASIVLLFVVCIVSYIVIRRLNAQKEHESIKANILSRELDVMAEQKKNSELKEASLQRKAILIEEFRSSPLYRRLTRQDTAREYKLTEEEWQKLEQTVDVIYGHFTSRLMALTNMSITELRICYLIKLNIPVSDIALLLNKTVGAVSHARGRLWKNITGEQPSAYKMDNYLKQM